MSDPNSPQQVPLLAEFGVSGLRRSGGIIIEEFLPQLRGVNGRKAFREMSENEPFIGGALLAIEEIVGSLDWRIEPPERPTPEEAAQGEFVQSCFDDMSESWDVTLAEILSMLAYGWSYHEIVYKVRGGRVADPTRRSRFTDGKIGWRKFAVRSQDTLDRWILDENGGLRGMVQTPMVGGTRTIPIQRALLFRARNFRGSPEGRSMLRTAYKPWWFKKRLEEIEAIGVERDLAGLPIAFGPEQWFQEGSGFEKNLKSLSDAVTQTRRNESDGLIFPSIIDDKGNRLLDFKLLSTGGTRAIDADKVIQRYTTAIATSMLQDFLTLGHEGVGSYALGAAKISLWQLVIESIAKSIAEVVNQHAIPRLMELNGWKPDRMPKLVYGNVVQSDLGVLAEFLSKMIESGVILPDPTLDAHVRDLAGLPVAQDAGSAFDQERVPGGGPAVPPTEPAAPAPAAEPTPTVDSPPGEAPVPQIGA